MKHVHVQTFSGSNREASVDAICEAVDSIAVAKEQSIQDGFDSCPFAHDLPSFAAGCKLGMGMIMALIGSGELSVGWEEKNNT